MYTIKILFEDNFKRFRRKKFSVENAIKPILDYGDRLSKVNDSTYKIYLREDFGNVWDRVNKYTDRLRNIGAKYIKFHSAQWYGDYYYITFKITNYSNSESIFNSEQDSLENAYRNSISGIDVDSYKPNDSILSKIIAYRNKGSYINVKAINDAKKCLTYFYACCLIGWTNQARELERKATEMGVDKSILNAIVEAVDEDSSYADPRSKQEIERGLPHNNVLQFNNNDAHILLPDSTIKYFISNNIPVRFDGRIGAGKWDNSGRQWSEEERLVLYPGDSRETKVSIVVHTNEGGGSNRYTVLKNGGMFTNERVSARSMMDAIADIVDRLNR